MAQVQNTPLTADPSILRDIESEVTQETRPLLQFIVNNAKLIIGVVVGLLAALAVAGAWRWHTQSQQEALQGELGQIMHQKATPEQLATLEKLAKDAPARLQAAVYAVEAQSALAQQNYAKAAEAYGRVARSLADMPLGVLGSVNEAASLDAVTNDLRLLQEQTLKLEELCAKAERVQDSVKQARRFCEDVLPVLSLLRAVADRIECEVPADLWSLPNYQEILFCK